MNSSLQKQIALSLLLLSAQASWADVTCTAHIGAKKNIPLIVQGPGMDGSDTVGPKLAIEEADVSISVKVDTRLLGTPEQPQLRVQIFGPVSLDVSAALGATGSNGTPQNFEYRQSLFVEEREISLRCLP